MSSKQLNPLLGITLGDPCGIGPEVVLRALGNRRARSAARFAVFGDAAILRKVAGTFSIATPRFQIVDSPAAIADGHGPFLVEHGKCPARLALLGKATPQGGRAAIAWIELAIEWARNSFIDAIVTAPINKEAVLKAGYEWPGHTELLAVRTGTRKPVMMMVGDDLRVALATTHVAIGDLPKRITRKNVLDTLRITHRDLRRYFGLRRPRLTVCGLNPHAGEAGRFGTEEARAICPAVRQARSEGVACEGPVPADVVFTRQYMKRYDAAVAMYHDQANIPVKLLAFDRGVNVTLGLPIIRTSPDHGTAFDIVRRGVANPGSMVAAVLLAAHMAGVRRGASRSSAASRRR